MRFMLKDFYFVLAALLVFISFGIPGFAQDTKPAALIVSRSEAGQWQEDLRYMAEEMPKWHNNLFHTMSREQFGTAVKNLHERIPQLARHRIIVEMARIAAKVGDGHTNIAPTRDPKIGFRSLPVKLYLFKDGLFIRAATAANAELVGARIVKIGNSTAEEAIKRAGEIVGRDNEMDIRFFAPHLLTMPEILHALEIVDDMESVPLVIKLRGGRQQNITLKPTGTAELLPPDTDTTWINKEGWIDLRDGAAAPRPLWLKNPHDKFWFEYLPDERMVYVQLNQVGNKDNESLADFSKRLFAFVDSDRIEKMIFDLRLNRGGNGTLLQPLLLDTIKSKINQPGKLFAIMGRGTWSAAQFLLNDFEKYTNTVFVGEPSGSKGNTYGDSRKITLPNSGLTVRVSVYYWQDWMPWDSRLWTAPNLTAELSSEDYRTNSDPAMKLITSYVPQKSLAEILNDALTTGGVDLAVRNFAEFKALAVNKYAAIEEPLLIAGSRLLKEKKPEQALILFKLNVGENPHSPRAYFAIGEAYFQSGNKEQAIKNFKTALELNPKFYDAAERLKLARKN